MDEVESKNKEVENQIAHHGMPDAMRHRGAMACTCKNYL